jgi:hypothetical protein
MLLLLLMAVDCYERLLLVLLVKILDPAEQLRRRDWE